jgi:hypothetical protein
MTRPGAQRRDRDGHGQDAFAKGLGQGQEEGDPERRQPVEARTEA